MSEYKRAPVALFVYNRLGHTKQVVEALSRNYGSSETEILIFSDAPKSAKDVGDVLKVREYVSSLQIFKSIRLIIREDNLGLSKSFIIGVTEVLNEYESIIVLEDDNVTSPYFLQFMNDALKKYQDDERVISISGYRYPLNKHLPANFFIKMADSWGWATWRQSWELYESDGMKLLDELYKRRLKREFDFNDSFSFTCMLEAQIAGMNDSWSVRWYASAFLKNKLTLYPCHSLVKNIGNDSTGTHCNTTNDYDVALATQLVPVEDIAVEESLEGREQFELFFRKIVSKPNRIMTLIRSFLNPRQVVSLRKLIVVITSCKKNLASVLNNRSIIPK